MLRHAAAVLALIACTAAAAAQPVALIALGAGETEADAAGLAAALRARGFAATVSRAAPAEALRRDLAALPADGADRIAIVLTGRFVHSARGAWLLGQGAGDAPSIRAVEASGISLVTLAEVAALAPRGAVLVLGEAAGPRPGAGLEPGIGPADWLPEGVALIRGPAALVPAFVRDGLLRPGQPLGAVVAARPGLALAGPGGTVLVPAQTDAAEEAAWEIARATGTAAAYEAFLQRWPAGRRAARRRRRSPRCGWTRPPPRRR